MNISAAHPGHALPRRQPYLTRFHRFLLLLILAWTAAVAGSVFLNVAHHRERTKSLTVQAAHVLLEKDLLYREWSILHGPVYIPKTDSAQRSASTPQEERDIETTSGQELTLLNPALVSRQIFQLQEESSGIRGHLLSLAPLNPGNLPDAWERGALQSFTSSQDEASTEEMRDGKRFFRLMRPLVIVPACLRCHEERGHQVGEIRGGISVTVPMSGFVTPGENEQLVLAHSGLWLVGMAGLILGVKNLEHHTRKRLRAEEALQRQLEEKEALLQEIHHRVKNNLQLVSSLLQLQINEIKDPQTLAVFQESQLRIRSMALIHEKLYQSDSLARVDLADYLRGLVELLFDTYAREKHLVKLELGLDRVFVSLNTAIPLGLIANELITNSLKFAFPQNGTGVIGVTVQSLPGDEILFRVSDNGKGLPEGFDMAKATSLGLRLVTMLTTQLRATGIWDEEPVGSSFSLRFKDTPRRQLTQTSSPPVSAQSPAVPKATGNVPGGTRTPAEIPI